MSVDSAKCIFLCVLIGILSMHNSGADQFPAENRLRDPRVICIDKVEDVEPTNWLVTSPNFNVTPPYVETSRDLPVEILQGKLDGQGIFYNRGGNQTTLGMTLSEYPRNDAARPVYIYVKYYVHIVEPNSNPKIHVRPARFSPDFPNQYLDSSRPNAGDFSWREEIIEMHTGTTWMTDLYVYDFGERDYFLMDKLILSEGFNVTNFSEMNQLCQY